MRFTQYITQITTVFMIFFDAGIVARIIQILIDGQMKPEQPTGKMVSNHIKAAIIVNLIGVLINIIKSYYT